MTHGTALLDAAERLFADVGIDGASLRSITNEAGANLASVNYHFGTKDGLVRAVLSRRFRPITEQRLAMLDACEATAGDGGPELECVLRAFVAPVNARPQAPRSGPRAPLLGSGAWPRFSS